MAFEDDVLDVAFKCSTDLSSSQYCFVKLTADDKVAICNGATDKAIGILQNKPNGSVTEAVARVRVFGVSRFYAAGTSTYGAYLGTDASGHGITKTLINTYYEGIVLSGSTGAGTTGTVLLFGTRTMNP